MNRQQRMLSNTKGKDDLVESLGGWPLIRQRNGNDIFGGRSLW